LEVVCSGVASCGALGHVPPSASSSFIFSSLQPTIQILCIVCVISWCRCQQLTALSISTALVTKLLVGLLPARRGHEPSSSPVVIVITSGCQTNETQYRRRPCIPSDRQSLLEHSSRFCHLCSISRCLPVTPQIILV